MPILQIPHHGTLDTSLPIDAERVLAGDPRQTVSNLYSDAGDEFHCGLWQAEPGTWRVRYTEHEFCHLLSGRVRIVEDGGVATEFGPGESFVVPAGFAGTWQVLETARKIYVIFEKNGANAG